MGGGLTAGEGAADMEDHPLESTRKFVLPRWSINTIFIPIISASIGAVVALIGTYGLQLDQRDWSKQSLASAYIGDINARITHPRIKYLTGLLSTLERGEGWSPFDQPSPHSFIMYEATADKLGILGPTFSKTIAEYYKLETISEENYRVLGDGRYLKLKYEDKIFFLKSYIKLEESQVARGKKIIDSLETTYELNSQNQ